MPHKTRSTTTIIDSPLGPLRLTFIDDKLTSLDFLSDSDKMPVQQNHMHAAKELAVYFSNAAHRPKITVAPEGTAFQLRVWKALQAIPSGKQITYGELAKQLNTSPRAIGQACRTNPIPVIIPCHRIIAAKHLGGYAGKQAGKMMAIKKFLLAHEGMATD